MMIQKRQYLNQKLFRDLDFRDNKLSLDKLTSNIETNSKIFVIIGILRK